MIKCLKGGWSKFKLGDFEGHPSYMTNVPLDLLLAFIDYHEKGSGCAYFDEETSEFTFVINPDAMYIIEEGEIPNVHHFDKIQDFNITELEKELIHDIEEQINDWQYFITDDDKEEIVQNRNELLQKIAILKNYIK